MSHSITIICGPTASGKSAHALELAEKSGGVIINADSQQLYREFRILTARPTEVEEARAPHKLFGILNLDEPCSAGKWLQMAKMEIDWALRESRMPIVVGGTGLYLRTLWQGIADIPDIPPEVRAQSANDLSAMGGEAFKTRLAVVDPVLGEKLKSGDTQRLIRAYEVWLGTGKPLSWWQAHTPEAPYTLKQLNIIYINLPRPDLYARIDQRVLQMIEEGAVEEVKQCDQLPVTTKIIGVPELTAYLSGQISLETAKAQIQQSTRNYAKRQITWFGNQLPK